MDLNDCTLTELELLEVLADCLNQSVGYYDHGNKKNYLSACGHCLSAYEDGLGILDRYGLLDKPRKRGDHGVVCRIRWEAFRNASNSK